MSTCSKCGGAGKIPNGKNFLPCGCPAGGTAMFELPGPVYGFVTGVEMRQHFLPDSPVPIATDGKNVFAADLPGRPRD